MYTLILYSSCSTVLSTPEVLLKKGQRLKVVEGAVENGPLIYSLMLSSPDINALARPTALHG